jgi:hypothetical protein
MELAGAQRPSGLGLIDQMHGSAEYVPVANLDAAAATYVDTARALTAAT